jgi:hypothetical protein
MREKNLDRTTPARIQGDLQKSDWGGIQWERCFLATRGDTSSSRSRRRKPGGTIKQTLTNHLPCGHVVVAAAAVVLIFNAG